MAAAGSFCLLRLGFGTVWQGEKRGRRQCAREFGADFVVTLSPRSCRWQHVRSRFGGKDSALFCLRDDEGRASVATEEGLGRENSARLRRPDRGENGIASPHSSPPEDVVPESAVQGKEAQGSDLQGDDAHEGEAQESAVHTVVGIVTEAASSGLELVQSTVEVVTEVAHSTAEAVVEKVEVVAQSTAEAVAETVEVAAQTVSSVGEIGDPGPAQETAASDTASALKTVAFWFGSAAAFGGLVALREGSGKASEFFAGYLLEQSLSVDNLFVFVLIFNYFRVPVQFQSRVLTYGLAGAVVFRAIMIGLGVATVQRFEGVSLVFAGILLFTAYKILAGKDEGDDDDDLSDNFVVKTCQKLVPVSPTYDGNKFFTAVDGVQRATPLLLTVIILELSDVAFAIDSIPAVLGVTRDPFIVFSSNIFAILGLRSLYTVIFSSMAELEYLQPAVGTVLGFIGSKLVAEYFGLHVPTEVSLGVVAAILATGAGLSLMTSKSSSSEGDDDSAGH